MALQLFEMQRCFPGFRLVARSRMTWRGDVQPRPDGATYTLQVQAGKTSKHAPKVTVIAPELVAAPRSAVPPHCFADGSLCLYHSSENPWYGDEFIARTILPWAAEWCYFYEVWLETGFWLGPEYPHSPATKLPH
jgi:hypothetical protein